MTKSKFGRLLDAQGRRVTWVAREVGVHRNMVGRWVSGKEPVSPARIPQLAELLGVDESEIAESEEAVA